MWAAIPSPPPPPTIKAITKTKLASQVLLLMIVSLASLEHVFTSNRTEMSLVHNLINLVDMDAEYLDPIPASFAVLINFGLDGKQRSLYSSDLHDERCRAGQIWDPFNDQCRQLSCHDNYQQLDFECVEDTGSSSNSTSKPNLKFLDTSSKFINVTLRFRLNETRTLEWVRSNQNTMVFEFIDKFSVSWQINNHRMIDIDLSYEETTALMEINFLLAVDCENCTKAADDVLKPLSEAVVHHQLRYTLMDVELTAQHIHTTVAEVSNFCMRPIDMPIWYWNNEFTLFNKDNLTYLYVFKTGRFYYPGEFMGSVLYVENGSGKNISSNAVVCEQTLIDETCPLAIYNRSEYEFVDGRHLYTTDHYYHDRYELTDNASVFTCLQRTPVSIHAKIQSILSLVLMIISISLLSIVLVTFARLRSIRRTVNGFNTINLVVCLEVMQFTFLANQYIDYCKGTASVFHFFILTTISWSCVIAFDMYQVFARKKNALVARRSTNTGHRRVLYSLVAYLIPLVIVVIAKLSDVFELPAMTADYGHVVPSSNFCWMRDRRALILYFIVPVALAQVFNLVLYACIVCNIRANIRSFTDSFHKVVVRIPSGSSQSSSTLSVVSSASSTEKCTSKTGAMTSRSEMKLNYNQTSIYLKLSVPLGFSWAIALFSPLIPSNHSVIITVMSYLFIIANTSQGVVLFLAFGVYRKMFAKNPK